jgi:hypothetical protein
VFFPPGETRRVPYTPLHCLLSKPGHRSLSKPPGFKPTPSPNPSHGALCLRPSSIQFSACLISLRSHWCYSLPSPPPMTTKAAAEAGTSLFFHHPCHLAVARPYSVFRRPPCFTAPPLSPPHARREDLATGRSPQRRRRAHHRAVTQANRAR